jgi:hypothetical protein
MVFTGKTNRIKQPSAQADAVRRRHDWRPLPRTPFGPHGARSGFSLVISLLLLGFMTMLLLSFSGLAHLETRNASRQREFARARQNALAGLNIAIGELQCLTGPDQRISAEASLQHPNADQPHWVGIYGNTVPASYTSRPSRLRLNSPTLLGWLISGNESATFSASTNASDFGRITQGATGLSFTPQDTVAGLNATTTATSDTLTIAGTDARLLVGPSTVGTVHGTDDFVVAPRPASTCKAAIYLPVMTMTAMQASPSPSAAP